MEPTQFLVMINSFDEATKANLKKMLYGSEASNIEENSQFVEGDPPMIRDLNPLCDDIQNTMAPNL